MNARIIPFKRPEPKETPTIPPPMLTGFEDAFFCDLLGTKEQLIAWGAAEERHFPVKPKRMAYNGSGAPSVRAIKGGLFGVHWHARRDEPHMGVEINAIARRVLPAMTVPERKTLTLLMAVREWRSDMIFSRLAGYDAGLLEPLDTALHAFEHAAVAMVTYRAKPEVVRLPPDETEPEHAQ